MKVLLTVAMLSLTSLAQASPTLYNCQLLNKNGLVGINSTVASSEQEAVSKLIASEFARTNEGKLVANGIVDFCNQSANKDSVQCIAIDDIRCTEVQ